jgi:hypothetical protein
MKKALAIDPNYVDAMIGWSYRLNMFRTGQITETEFQTRTASTRSRRSDRSWQCVADDVPRRDCPAAG